MDRIGTSRAHHQQQNAAQQQQSMGRPVSALDAATACDVFEHFIRANTLKTILGTYRHICELLHLRPNVLPLFYPKLKSYLTSWKAKALWKKFDARASQKCYGGGRACPGTRVLIIGAGPCGLRTAIDAQLLGAKVVVVEKRDRLSRNNVLHLWPFVIEDLRGLGAKKFFGKFCAGAIDHISIRQLQCILLKVALLLGVEVHTEVSFEKLVEPNENEKIGWHAEFKPLEHPVSQYEFDVIIGADGKRNTLQGFQRNELRGKLAIAITANFINHKTEIEARVQEISGVAYIFNQKFFKDLKAETGIDLENIVYYKDETHYFVMTARKQSLISKGVIKQDYVDTAKLLAPENVDREQLMNYAREAADFSTNYQLPDLKFAVNYYGEPDVAMFDFTSIYAAENASRIIERHGYRLLMELVGDSLLEPFWPTGSGCARGFLSSMDACWAIRAWGSGIASPLEVIAERESIYRLLGQTTPDKLNKDYKSYTVDPTTRYPNLNKNLLVPRQVVCHYDTDNPAGLQGMLGPPNLPEPEDFRTRTNKQPIAAPEMHRKRRRRDTNVDPSTLLSWVKDQVRDYDLQVEDITSSFKDGRVLCAIIHHYRPDLLDYASIDAGSLVRNNQLAFDLLEKEIGIPPVMTGEEMALLEVPDYLTMLSYLTQIYDTFRVEIPHIKYPKLELPDMKLSDKTPQKIHSKFNFPKVDSAGDAGFDQPISRSKRHVDTMSTKTSTSDSKRPKKRKSFEKVGATMDKDAQLPSQTRGGTDEEFAARIKEIEQKWTEPVHVEKKPKDLLRAIGKIETSDWNIKEIEKKILENKHGKVVNREKEKVPKWNREQFLARQTKMEKKGIVDRQDSVEAKFSEFDRSIKQLDQKLKEGSVRELGKNKVATITEKLTSKIPENEPKPISRSNSKLVIPTQSGSEYCHFCQKRVYLMERLSAEGKFFHRGCFRCQYCHTSLRLGSYLFDKDGRYGNRFYCSQHFGMPGELYSTKIGRKVSQKVVRDNAPQLEKLQIPQPGVMGVDLLDRVQTPERIEFSNLSAGHLSSDHEESFSQMDEDEWTDRNFGTSAAEISDDESSSSDSDSESDNEDAYEEALEEPATKEGTLRWIERCLERYSRDRAEDDSVDDDDYSSGSDHSSYYENSSGDEDDDTATEGEEEIRARELRKQEVCLEPPIIQTDTGSETEIMSDKTSPESSNKGLSSATEVSTDSEFALEDPTPTRERPPMTFSEARHKKRWAYNSALPKKVQVKTGMLQAPTDGKVKVHKSKGIQLEFTPLVPSPVLPQPAQSLFPRSEGYALNRTQSTGGIATKVSLELKKKYLLGDSGSPGVIQKSGSVSALDSKLKSFHSNITDCQKLLKPAPEVSLSMQVFCSKLDERKSPLSPIFSQSLPLNDKEQDKVKSKPPDLVDLTLSPSERKPSEVIDLTSSPQGLTMQPDITKCIAEEATKSEQKDSKEEKPFEHELEGRPRSPVQDIPIIVPQIDWSKKNKMNFTKDMYSDSLTSESDNEESEKKTDKVFPTIPRLEIHDDSGQILQSVDEMAADSLCITEDKKQEPEPPPVLHEPNKNKMTEKKTLNQPKTLPNLDFSILSKFHDASHEKQTADHQPPKTVTDQNKPKSDKEKTFNLPPSSVCSTPSEHDSLVEQMTAAMTETELSDWAREGIVSDDLEEDFEFNLEEKDGKRISEYVTVRKKDKGDKPKTQNLKKEKEDDKRDLSFFDSLKNTHNSDSGSIEFMDNDVGSSSDERERELYEARNKNNGYIQLQDEDDIAQDSLSIYDTHKIVETKNMCLIKSAEYNNLSTNETNTGYCFFGNEEASPKKISKPADKKTLSCDNEDSLVVVEQTTTEENSCSNSTVKNITEREYNTFEDKNEQKTDEKESVSSETPERLQTDSEVKKDMTSEEKTKESSTENVQEKHQKEPPIDIFIQNLNDEEYQEHCQRLQSKIGFGNVRDSIDIRKSKRKDRIEHIPQPSLIVEEKQIQDTPPTTPRLKTPGTLYIKEEIKKERDENQRLIQEMVLNKMKAQNKSLERKRRNRNSLSPSTNSFQLCKSATIDISPRISSIKQEPEKISEEPKNNVKNNNTPDVLLSTGEFMNKKFHPVERSKTVSTIDDLNQYNDQLNNICTTPKQKEPSPLPDVPLTNIEIYSLTSTSGLDTPLRPPRQKIEDTRRSTMSEHKLQQLREKTGKENEATNVQKQDSIESLVLNTERRNSLLYSNDTLTKKRNNSFKRSKSGDDSRKSLTEINSRDISGGFPERTKSVSEISRPLSTCKSLDINAETTTEKRTSICQSDPNLLGDAVVKRSKKKSKDPERRKSITKMISDFFNKKKDGSSTSKGGFLSKISPKSKDKSKAKIFKEPVRSKSYSDVINRNDPTPPPIPPLPTNYTGCRTDDSSDGELDYKDQNRSSCDTLDQSLEGRRGSRSRKASKQAQLKRHRLAQELQRKLEEVDVKTKQLEEQGVIVEKKLRGEIEDDNGEDGKDEPELLREWFDLMRDLNELRRYERELSVRAQELELEDRHARLQQELREHLQSDEHKTKEDLETESSIINEMIEIVAKRDSLVALLEQDRQRYSEEDRDFEERMLAKGLQLTSIRKSPVK